MPGKAPPLWSALATVLCAAFGLAGWASGLGTGSFVLYVLSYLAGGTMATVTAVSRTVKTQAQCRPAHDPGGGRGGSPRATGLRGPFCSSCSR